MGVELQAVCTNMGGVERSGDEIASARVYRYTFVSENPVHDAIFLYELGSHMGSNRHISHNGPGTYVLRARSSYLINIK